MPELIGPDVIYTNPYTGLPTVDPKNNKSAYYPHQTSPHVSWGYKKSSNVLWVESEWNLEGPITINPNVQMTAAKLVTLKGLGQSLSGDWWISTVTHTIDNQSGYTMQMDLMRNAAGDTPTPPATPAQQNPTRPPATKVTPSQAPKKTYTVKSGDNLWNIARKYYGKGSLYTRIAAANPRITNPNLIYPGWSLIIP